MRISYGSSDLCSSDLLFHKLVPEQVIVLYDEINLAPGKVRVKQGGGTGGHNGIRSLEAHIGKEFWRVRLGVGHPGLKDLVHGHVLSDFAKADKAWLEKLLAAVADAVPLLARGDAAPFIDRHSGVEGQGGYVRVNIGGWR